MCRNYYSKVSTAFLKHVLSKHMSQLEKGQSINGVNTPVLLTIGHSFHMTDVLHIS